MQKESSSGCDSVTRFSAFFNGSRLISGVTKLLVVDGPAGEKPGENPGLTLVFGGTFGVENILLRIKTGVEELLGLSKSIDWRLHSCNFRGSKIRAV